MDKYKFCEPYGFIEGEAYYSLRNTIDDEIKTNREIDKQQTEEAFAKVEYNKDLESIIFKNVNGEAIGQMDMTEIVASALIKEAKYDKETQQLIIEFDNGDVITIDLADLINIQEAGDGLQLDGNKFSVKIADDSEGFLQVTSDGLKNVGIQEAIDTEKDRAIAAEEQETADRIADVDEEEARAKEAELLINQLIEAEINNRISDVDEEEARAISAETALDGKIDAEITRSTTKDEELEASIAEEANLRASKDTELEGMINNEATAREAADEALNALISGLDESKANKAEAVASAEYVSGEKKINFKDISGTVISSIDTSDFVVDGMVKDVKIENGKLIIDFNTDSGIEDIEIPLTDIFNPDNYYDKDAIDAKVTALESADTTLQSNITAEATARADKDTELNTKIDVEIEARIAANDAQDAVIAQKADSSAVTADIAAATADMATQTWVEAKNYLTEHQSLSAYSTTEEVGTLIATATADMATKTWVGEQGYLTEHQDISNLATKDEVDEKIESAKTEYYTKEEVDALIKTKETEIYNLTKIVGEMGGNVTYTLPNELGTSFNSLMNNNGTVKLTEDTTTGRFGPGLIAKNKVTLNLNNNDLTISGLTSSSSQPGIMARGTQVITIGGKGTIDTGEGICIEAATTGSTINLTGTTTTYQTNRSGGELIYCYAGTINISGGIFRNNGENKTFTLNCYDANYQNGTAKIIVTGGKFYDFNPGNNNAEGPGTSFLAEGYHVETSTVTEEGVEHTIYTVKKDA